MHKTDDGTSGTTHTEWTDAGPVQETDTERLASGDLEARLALLDGAIGITCLDAQHYVRVTKTTPERFALLKPSMPAPQKVFHEFLADVIAHWPSVWLRARADSAASRVQAQSYFGNSSGEHVFVTARWLRHAQYASRQTMSKFAPPAQVVHEFDEHPGAPAATER